MSRSPTWLQAAAPAILGVGACAACCAVPLVTLFVGAGAASTLAAVAEPIAGVLLAASLLLGGVVLDRRRMLSRATTCQTAGTCATDRSCGCAPALDVGAAQAAGCTLDPAEIPDRGEAFRGLFSRALKRRVSSSSEAEWTLGWSAPGEAEVRALAAAESGCCSFFAFDIDRSRG